MTEITVSDPVRLERLEVRQDGRVTIGKEYAGETFAVILANPD